MNNKGKGGSKTRRGPKRRDNTREMPLPGSSNDPYKPDTYVGIVTKSCGSCRFNVQLLTKTTLSKVYNCSLPHSLQRQGFIVVGTHVLFSEMQGDKGEICHVYTDDNVRELVSLGLICEATAQKDKGEASVGGIAKDTGFDFTSGDSTVIENEDGAAAAGIDMDVL